MAKLSRKQIRKMILREMKKVEEDALYTQHKVGHEYRSAKHASCQSCGVEIYVDDKDVCGKCVTMYEKHDHSHDENSSCNEHGHVFEDGSCSECGIMEEEVVLQEGDCGGCGSCGPCNSMSDSPDLQSLIDLMLSEEEHDDADVKIGNHKHYKGSYMARSHLYKVAKYAEKLYNMIPEGHNLEDWMRSKIAQIADDIGEVYHAIDHDIFDGDI